MTLKNAYWPTQEQLEAFLKADTGMPYLMLNLLTFKAKAEYEDGRETTMTGAEAYQVYVRELLSLVEPLGGEFVHFGPFDSVLIGEGQNAWDATLMMRYPSRQQFVEVIGAPSYQAVAPHRAAALKDQLLLSTTAYD